MPPDEPREIGSEFHWDPAFLLAEPGGPLPARHELFATGCGAAAALLRSLPPGGRLHVPSYFCVGVAAALSALRPIVWYRHLPDGFGPRWDTLRARDGDVVLAQNLFGREPGGPWRAWIAAHPGVTVLEDHSHDPFGDWARHSTASYAVASLRKTLPLPDGGLLWSPRGLPLSAPHGPVNAGSELKLAAMLLKAAWLAGRPVPREAFRRLQRRGERALLGSAGPPAALTTAVLPSLDVLGLRAASTWQAGALVAALPARTAAWQVVGGGPVGAAPFRVQLLCRDGSGRDDLQRHLARHRIYAPVHWRQDRTGWWSGDEEAAALGDRLLTVPVDHRCGAVDVRRVAAALTGYVPAGDRPGSRDRSAGRDQPGSCDQPGSRDRVGHRDPVSR